VFRVIAAQSFAIATWCRRHVERKRFNGLAVRWCRSKTVLSLGARGFRLLNHVGMKVIGRGGSAWLRARRCPGVVSGPGEFDAVAFRYGKREIGHVYRVTKEVRERLLAVAGRSRTPGWLQGLYKLSDGGPGRCLRGP
jgi:hypothetical protein